MAHDGSFGEVTNRDNGMDGEEDVSLLEDDNVNASPHMHANEPESRGCSSSLGTRLGTSDVRYRLSRPLTEIATERNPISTMQAPIHDYKLLNAFPEDMRRENLSGHAPATSDLSVHGGRSAIGQTDLPSVSDTPVRHPHMQEKVFWLNGRAGVGKSTLKRFLESDKRTEEALKDWAGPRELHRRSDYEITSPDSDDGNESLSEQGSMAWSAQDRPITTDPTTAEFATLQKSNESEPKHAIAAESIYTGGSDIGLDETRKVRLLEWFVQHILEDMEGVPQDREIDIASLLLTYQKVLRLRTTCELHLTFTRFVRRKRAAISKMLSSEQSERIRTTIGWKSRIDTLWPSLGESAEQDPNIPVSRPEDVDLSNLEETDERIAVDSPELVAAKRFLFDGHEYHWLISRLKRECTMASTGDNSALTRSEISHGLGTTGKLSIKLHWDPVAFLKDQFQSRTVGGLADIVCIVGSATSAYAATCSEYLGSVWSSLGRAVLRFIDLWIQKGAPDSYGSSALTDFGIKFQVSLLQGWLLWSLEAESAELVVEVSEILCFLSTVCRTSRHNEHGEPSMEVCFPRVSQSSSEGSSQPLLHVEPEYEPLCDNAGTSDLANGACWRPIFWNPVVAIGYPIPAREPLSPGLQISLQLLGGLTHISRALMYDDILMLKGFCNMLVPTKHTGTAVVWHYILNEDFAWMSHNRAEEICKNVAKIDFQNLDAATSHFVGWVTSSQLNVCKKAPTHI
jgi:hypothetical protein